MYVRSYHRMSQLNVLLKICLIVISFKSGVDYKSVAYKNENNVLVFTFQKIWNMENLNSES